MTRVELDEDGLVELMTAADGPIARDLRKRGRRVERAAKRHCPVDLGRLRSSIQVGDPEVEGDDLVVTVGSDVEYALAVELGDKGEQTVKAHTRRGKPVASFQRTANTPMQPYLRPALSAAADQARRASTPNPNRQRSRSSYIGGLRDDDEGDIG